MLDKQKIAAILKIFAEHQAKRQLRLNNPQVLDIIRALSDCTKRRRSDVIEAVFYARNERGNKVPPSFEKSLQSSFNQHNLDLSVWKKNAAIDKAIFYCPGGSGSGWWAVNQERALAWLTARKMEEEA